MNIGFLVPWPLNADLTSYWVLWASVATAIGTGLLAWFAYLAWNSAKETLKGQQKSEQLAAVSRYVNALYALARVSKSTPPKFMPPSTGNIHVDFALREGQYGSYVDHLVDEVEINGGFWRAYHSGSSTSLSPIRDGESVLIEAQNWWKNPNEELQNHRDEQFKLNATFGRELARLTSDWQVREHERKALGELIDHEVEKFLRESPCNPGKANQAGSSGG